VRAGLNDRAAALADLEAFCAAAPGAAHVPALLQLAELHRDNHDYAAAERWLAAADAVDAADERVRRARLVLLAAAGRAAEIPNALAAADVSPELLLTGVWLLRDRSDLRGAAVDLARRVCAADPENTLAHAQLALLLYQSGDTPGALAAYEALLTSAPDHAEALNNVAWILAERGNQLDRALLYARKAVGLRPDDANFRDTLGTVLRGTGQLRDARTEFLRGLELTGASDDTYASLFLHAAETAAELNDWSSVREIAAQALGEAALREGPARNALEQLQREALERTN
jgi:tetratricopeptide (TPR) repeat protein